MRLNELSPEAQNFFGFTFDLNDDIRDANCSDDYCRFANPIHFAAYKGKLEFVQELVAVGIDINQLDKVDRLDIFGPLTPLMYIAKNRSLFAKKKLIQAMIALGADIYQTNGKHPPEDLMTFAVYCGDINLFECFLEMGFNPLTNSSIAKRLMYRLANLMENSPYQFIRALRLMAKIPEHGMAYFHFELEFLKMLEDYRSYILSYSLVMAEERLNRPEQGDAAQLAQVQGQAQTESLSESENIVPAQVEIPRPPMRPRAWGEKKLLRDIQTGEDMVNGLRVYLDNQSYTTYLEMTSKWMRARKKCTEQGNTRHTWVLPDDFSVAESNIEEKIIDEAMMVEASDAVNTPKEAGSTPETKNDMLMRKLPRDLEERIGQHYFNLQRKKRY